MADEIQGIEKDPRVESLYGASKDSPGLCDVREEAEPPQCRYDHNGDGNCHRCYRAGGGDAVSLAEDVQD